MSRCTSRHLFSYEGLVSIFTIVSHSCSLSVIFISLVYLCIVNYDFQVSFNFEVNLYVTNWGGSRGASEGSVEPPKLEPPTSKKL